ncbi:ABC transporter permease subunit [Bacillus sp. FJAT-42376]|uniref:ABC transporter permease subunit n=1 Tax=Bacillus sp. FJAT-42376 TaxID=2014076 RepID=UPI000F4F7262|nr:ABC transporter permease subunit [Bacillus sp. FJAT-42376]AZB44063.1 ABC transporter permease subunit [Bacillus sp. FJAT-42376]
MKWFKNRKLPAGVIPSILIAGILLLSGLLFSLYESVRTDDSLSLHAYAEIWSGKSFQMSFLYSVSIALLSSLLAIGGGLFITRAIAPFMRRPFFKLLTWSPMLFPHFVWGYMLVLLIDQTGWIPQLLTEFGVLERTDQFPVLIRDEWGIGIILTYVTKEIPFVILMLIPLYLTMDGRKRDVITSLGGTKWNVFKTAEWPVIIPVLSETFIILFAFILTAYEVPALLGITFPKMVSVLAFEWFYNGDWSHRPLAYAAMLTVTVLILLLSVLFYFLWGRNRRTGKESSRGTVFRKKGSKTVLTIYMLLVFMPIAALAGSSFLQRNHHHVFSSQPSARAWKLLLEDPLLVQAVWTSIGIGVMVVLLNYLIGIPAARALAFKEFKGKTFTETVLLAPILVPALLVAMGLHIAFIRLGLANEWSGVVLIQLLPTLPYTVKMFRAGFEQMGISFEQQARTLGASKLEIVKSIYLPMLLSSFRASAFLLFVISLGQFVLTSLIGGGSVLTLALVYFPYFEQADTAVLAAFSLLFAVIPLGVWAVFEAVFRILSPYKGRF